MDPCIFLIMPPPPDDHEPDPDQSDALRDGDFLANELRNTINRCSNEAPLTVYTTLGVLARLMHEYNARLDLMPPPHE